MITIGQSKTALAAGLTASFAALGGTAPYIYSVRPNGAGGVIDSAGLYTAPNVINGGQYITPSQLFDLIQVVDSATPTPLQALAKIFVGTPLLLFCDIIQNQLNLPVGRVYLWDQKIMQPTDSGLYVVVSVVRSKPFGNSNKFDGTTGQSQQSVNMYAELQIDIISRDTEARDRKEEVIMALASDYAVQQQEANSFNIGKLPAGAQFINLSNEDGAAIPYRFAITVGFQYFVTKLQATQYFDTFQGPDVTTES